MRENNIKIQQESNGAFAFATLLLNLLVLLVVCGTFWVMYSVLNQSNGFSLVLHETALR